MGEESYYSEDEEDYEQSSSGSDPKRSSGKLKDVAAHTPIEIFHGIIAFCAVGSSITAMILNWSTLTLIAGAACSFFGPYAYYQQTKLTDIIALKEACEAITRENDRLAAENVRLNETVGDLSSTVDKLEDVEQALDVITQTQGQVCFMSLCVCFCDTSLCFINSSLNPEMFMVTTIQSVATYAQQVKEYENMFLQMEKNLRANVLQNLLQVVIRSDEDDNMTIEEDEIDDLVERIQKINGVEVVYDRFKAAIMESGGSLSSVMDIIKNLMADDGDGDEEGIFIIRDRKSMVC
jgi:regulator of replication initiation timing